MIFNINKFALLRFVLVSTFEVVEWLLQKIDSVSNEMKLSPKTRICLLQRNGSRYIR